MIVELLNSCAAHWADFMWTALIDGTVLLAVVAAVWLALHRRASAQLGYLLFLMIIVRLALPLSVPVPASLGWLSPREAGARLWQRLIKAPNMPRVNGDAATREAIATAEDLDAHRDLLPQPTSPTAMIANESPQMSVKTWLMLTWGAIVAALFSRFLWVQCCTSRRFRDTKPISVDKHGIDSFLLGRRMGLHRPVPLVTSDAVGSPVVWGLCRPRLILPTDLADRLPRDQFEWVLLHELAHVRRGDLWVALAQRLVQIVYFFHPAVWLANWQVDRQREFACDDAALAVAHSAGRDCAAALVAIAEWACGASPRPALGLLHSNTLLGRRVVRLMSAEPATTPRLSIASVVSLVVAGCLVVPHLRAQVEPIQQPESEQTQPNSDGAGAVKTVPSSTAEGQDVDDDKGDGKDEQADKLPPFDRRVAALKIIQRAGGRAWADPQKYSANDLNNPKRPFLTAEFYRVSITDDVLEALSAFPELQRLHLSESGVTDDQLARLPQRNLKHLDLSDTPITDDGLRRLPANVKLNSLLLTRTAVTGKGLASLASLQNLQQVILDRTAVDDAGIGHLVRLPKLAVLSLNDTNVGDAALEHLRNTTSLEHLGLSRTQVTDAGLVSLQELSKLATLQLDNTRVTDLAIEAIERLSEISDLRLDDTHVTDASASRIASWTKLRLLHLGGTGISEFGVKSLRDLRKLFSLNLARTKTTDAALQSLANMQDLKFLDLTETPITDTGLNFLKPLIALRQLNLSGTQIADSRLEALKELPHLTSVNVSGTEVTSFDVFRSLPQTIPNVQAILGALPEKTELDFAEQPLTDVIDYLRQRHEIEIQLDMKSLTDAGVGSDTPITRRLKGVSLREALQTMLDPLKLTFGVRHEVLLIVAKPLPETVSNFPVAPAGQRLSPKIAEAFMQRTEFNFRERPLSKVVEYFAKKHNVDLQLDPKSLADAGIGFNVPITRSIKGITLKSALELVLDDLNLTCVAEGEKVTIRAK